MRTDISYLYDGSFEGALCCIFEAFYKHEQPQEITAVGAPQQSLFFPREIIADKEKAARVITGLKNKVSHHAAETVRLLFLTCELEKELLMLSFVRLAFKQGKAVSFMHADPTVARVNKAVQHLTGEAHLYKGFVRFSDIGGVLAAQIEPKNHVLPLLAPHFCTRFNSECFIIHDKTHGQALVYQSRRQAIMPLLELDLAKPDKAEREYRGLWKLFYDTIAIEERYNPTCRRTHMPMRYWNCLTELDGENDLFKKELPEKGAQRRLGN